MLRWRSAFKMADMVSPDPPASKVSAIWCLPGATRTTSFQPPEGGGSAFAGVGGRLARVGDGPAGMRVGLGLGVAGVVPGAGPLGVGMGVPSIAKTGVGEGR